MQSSMLITLFCFGSCFYLGRKAVWAGFIATMTVGYFYGIIRANLDDSLAYFFYDVAVIGFYLAVLINPKTLAQRYKLSRIMPWLIGLYSWPLLLMLAPTQPFLVQLVGLRGNTFFLPFIAVGAVLEDKDVGKIAWALAILNIVALVFALLEVLLGVPFFFPYNAVDQIIYRSTDVLIGGNGTFRIPSIFANAAQYGGNMTASFPLLVGALVNRKIPAVRRKIFWVALGASAIGVFLSASRSQAGVLFILAIAITVSGRIREFPRFGWMAMAVFVALLVYSSTRMQRFLTLDNTRYVKTRISNSVNESFLSFAFEYPMGNGLGGGGTSVPYFLETQLRNPVNMENEYGRIMLEEGLPGLALWVWFLIWTLTRPLPRKSERWYLARWLARVFVGVSCALATTGTGLFTSIPGTACFMLYAGWFTAPAVINERRRTPALEKSEVQTRGASAIP
jgi:hypothetical protein